MKTMPEFESEIKELKERIESKDERIRKLENLVEQFKHLKFGTSSEKTTSEQANLFDEAELEFDDQIELIEQDEAEIEVPAHKRKKKKRPAIPEDAPVEDIIYDLTDEEKICSIDGTQLVKMGEETHKQVKIIPQQIKVIRHVRFKYTCPCCAKSEKKTFKTAPKPALPIEKSIATPSLLSYIITNKYCDGMPLYRQVETFKRYGFEFDRTSFANWMIKCGDLVQVLIKLIQEKIIDQSVVHIDETPVQVLKEPDKTAQSQSYMWVMSTPEYCEQKAVIYNYTARRSAQHAIDMLDGFHGALMADGYPGYNKVARELNLKLLACWVHARRYFKKAQLDKSYIKGKVNKADMALNYIAKLYAIEKRIKNMSVQEKYEVRQSESKKILDAFKKWLDKQNETPKSDLGRAINYTRNQWDGLVKYIESGEYPIDNNLAENAVRPFVIGRKNWLFSDTQKGATASANLYSLIETAKANGLNTFEYLEKVLTDLPNAKTVEEIEALLPWNI
ncbi:IS66 family transposase [Marinicellulosiphila megalodicopiae]|uniref:IS66 family transposase n=1 Tax=Marinicellulosiphila megalodicopiae TaxID=2724896 RepID=UPI003BAE635D